MADHTLTLLLDTKKEFNFHLHELVLKEGISQISDAHLTLYTNEDITMEDLNSLVSSAAAVKIVQKDDSSENNNVAGKLENSRWYQGMITSVKHCGVVESTENQTVKKIEMHVQSPIVNLKYAFRKRRNGSITPKAMITKILDDYGLTYEFLNEPPNIEQDFNQKCESDYDFLMRILLQCRMNYIFQSTIPSDDNSAATFPKMYIFQKDLQPAAEMTLESSNDIAFKYEKESKSFWTMNHWEMAQSIGVDAVAISYKGSSGNVRVVTPENSSDEKKRRVLFDFSVFSENNVDTIKKTAETFLHCYQCEQYRWKGNTASFAAIPGSKIAINGFFGAQDSIKSIVASGCLRITAQWPANLGTAPETTPKLSLDINCLDPNTIQDFICVPDSDIINCVKKLAEGYVSSEIANAAMPNDGGSNHIVGSLVTAVVCDKNGGTESNTTTSLDSSNYEFYAIIDGDETNTPVKVKLLLPLGGFKQGLFRVPRSGDQVLLHQTSGAYYLAGYLPNKTEMLFADDFETPDGGYDSNEMVVLRYNNPNQENLDGVKGGYVLPKKDLDGEFVDKKELKDPNQFSEIGFYHKKIASEESSQEESETLVNIQSSGSLHLSSNDVTEIQAKNITISTPGWVKCKENEWNHDNGNIKVKDFNELTITAEHSIKFQVGNNYISITPNGITIRSTKYTGAPGLMDSAIYMDSLSGISLTGAKCSMHGWLGAYLRDAAGANIAVSAGATSLTGGILKLGTFRGIDFIKNGVVAMISTATQIAAMIFRYTSLDEEKVDNSVYGFHHGGIYIADIIMRLYDWKEKWNREGITAAEQAIMILDIITDTINCMWVLADAIDSPWLSEPAAGSNGKVTNRDAFRICALASQLSAYICALTNIIPELLVYDSVAIKINSSEIDMSAARLDIIIGEGRLANNPLK